MTADLFLSVNPFETRVAMLENTRLVSYRAERHRASSVVGNVYKGRVNRVLPGMQAAFVDIGMHRNAFLYVREAGGILDDYTDIFLAENDEAEQPDPMNSDISDLLQEGQVGGVHEPAAGPGLVLVDNLDRYYQVLGF